MGFAKRPDRSIRDDAHDSQPWRTAIRRRAAGAVRSGSGGRVRTDSLANRILPRKKAICERLVDDDDGFASIDIAPIDATPAKHTAAHPPALTTEHPTT